jgi:hypothetical protein
MQRITFRIAKRTSAAVAGPCVLALLFVAACVPREGGDRFYVVVKPEYTERFLNSVVSMAKDMGLTPDVGHAVDDDGAQLHVIEATNRQTRLWVQNVLLSGREDPRVCGAHDGTYSDPAQFVLYTKPTWLTLDSKLSTAVAGEMFARLKLLGYAVRKDQALCGLAHLTEQ